MGAQRRSARQPASAGPDAAGGPLPTDPVVPADSAPKPRNARHWLTMPDDWDSRETNQAIAEDFYR